MTAIATTGLTKRYDDVLAVDDLDLTVDRGEVFGFVGPNGAGKSTTIAMLLGYRFPTAGSATVLGEPVHLSPSTVRARVGVLPETSGLFERMTGVDHLRFAIAAHGSDDRIDALLDRVGLDDAGYRRAGGYSTGMAQRLRLALALVARPDLLILDEPAAGLDPAGVRLLRDIVTAERDRGAAVFFSSHNLADVAAVCDRVGFLIDGRLVDVVDPDALEDSLADRFDRVLREAT